MMIFYGANTSERLDRIVHLLTTLLQENHKLASQLDDLAAQVAATLAVEQSAIILIDGIADRIAAAGVDPAKLTQLQADLAGSTRALAAAVAANTPAAPAPEPAPTPEPTPPADTPPATP